MTPKRVLTARKQAKPSPFDYPCDIVGGTPYVQVWVAKSLGLEGKMVAQVVFNQAETDYSRLARLFIPTMLPPVTIVVAPLSGTHDGTGGAYHYGCNGVVLYCDADFQRPQRTSALFIAELSEVGQAAQGLGFDCGASNGEGLSRVHAEVLYPGALDDYECVSAWLDGVTRPDWVNNNNATDQDEVSNGCSVLFLWWLVSLGYSIAEITRAGSQQGLLSNTYQALTGKLAAQAFSIFNAAVDKNWPIGKPSNVNVDNPWGSVAPPNPPQSPAPGPAPFGVTLTLFADVKAGTYTLTPI